MSEEGQAMTITEQDIKNLTPAHRIVWHQPPGQPVEMGLYVNGRGDVCTDAGHLVRYGDGSTLVISLSRIVRVIPPAFVPRVGLVIGKPDFTDSMLVCVEEGAWLGYAPELDADTHWFTDDAARDLVENYGWKVMGDLAAQGEVTHAEVKAAAQALMEHPGVRQNVWHTVARAALEASREARNE
jgi:hypothetical protein